MAAALRRAFGTEEWRVSVAPSGYVWAESGPPPLPSPPAAAETPKPTRWSNSSPHPRGPRRTPLKRLLDGESLARRGAQLQRSVHRYRGALLQAGEGFVPPRKARDPSDLMGVARSSTDSRRGALRRIPRRTGDRRGPRHLTARACFGWTPAPFRRLRRQPRGPKLLLDAKLPSTAAANTKFRNTPLQVSLLTAQEEMPMLWPRAAGGRRAHRAGGGLTALTRPPDRQRRS